jgi:hypothetical protein
MPLASFVLSSSTPTATEGIGLDVGMGSVKMLHTVVQVKPTREFKVYLYCDDGKIKLFDMSLFLDKGVFKQISEIDAFIQKCAALNHTLAWEIGGNFDEYNCIDIDPETIYSTGVDVKDPLSSGTDVV